MRLSSLIYVSYSPYENQGKILEYILDRYDLVVLFSLGHHNIDKRNITNRLTLYCNHKIIIEENIFFVEVPTNFVFLVLPIRSLCNFIQILFKVLRLKGVYGQFDNYFSVNGYAAWIGQIIKKLKLVKKTTYWVCDYYPIKHSNKIIALMRWVYWQFERRTVGADLLAFHNNRLVRVWKKNKCLDKKYKPLLIPIGTLPLLRKRKKGPFVSICFLGVVKKSQGLDYIIDCISVMRSIYSNLRLDIIGPGPDTPVYEDKLKGLGINYVIHGYVSEKKIDNILMQSSIGVATYIPDPENVSYYGDPGKIKRYLSAGLPVIATKIHEFSYEVEKKKAGIIVRYGDVPGFVKAVGDIIKNYLVYSKNAHNLSKKYYYKKIYKKMFT